MPCRLDDNSFTGKGETRSMKRKVIVRRSQNGLGVFARTDLRADFVVGRIEGIVRHADDSDPHYCIELDGEMVLEPGPPWRSLNHSCEANCEIFEYDDEDDEDDEDTPQASEMEFKPLFLGTRRPVAAGEELTIDYAWPAESAIPCNCGTRACRGWIVAEDERELV